MTKKKKHTSAKVKAKQEWRKKKNRLRSAMTEYEGAKVTDSENGWDNIACQAALALEEMYDRKCETVEELAHMADMIKEMEKVNEATGNLSQEIEEFTEPYSKLITDPAMIKALDAIRKGWRIRPKKKGN